MDAASRRETDDLQFRQDHDGLSSAEFGRLKASISSANASRYGADRRYQAEIARINAMQRQQAGQGGRGGRGAESGARGGSARPGDMGGAAGGKYGDKGGENKGGGGGGDLPGTIGSTDGNGRAGGLAPGMLGGEPPINRPGFDRNSEINSVPRSFNQQQNDFDDGERGPRYEDFQDFDNQGPQYQDFLDFGDQNTDPVALPQLYGTGDPNVYVDAGGNTFVAQGDNYVDSFGNVYQSSGGNDYFYTPNYGSDGTYGYPSPTAVTTPTESFDPNYFLPGGDGSSGGSGNTGSWDDFEFDFGD